MSRLIPTLPHSIGLPSSSCFASHTCGAGRRCACVPRGGAGVSSAGGGVASQKFASTVASTSICGGLSVHIGSGLYGRAGSLPPST